jgi:hypothetical protein
VEHVLINHNIRAAHETFKVPEIKIKEWIVDLFQVDD